MRRLALVLGALAAITVGTIWATVCLPQKLQEDDIREAVFRYQFMHNASALQQSANSYYLAVGVLRRDPSPKFISRFRGHTPSVKPVSCCTVEPGEHVKDISTARPGLIFTAAHVKWISRTEAYVLGGYYEGSVSSSGNVYRVVRIRGHWVVKQDTMLWIS